MAVQGPSLSRAEAAVRSESDGNVAVVSLARPDRRNALDAATCRELVAALHATAADDGVHVVLLRGDGMSFCSGHDLGELTTSGPLPPEAPFEWLRTFHGEIARFPKPLVAAAHGVIGPAGTELLLAADLVVAAESTVLSYEVYRAGGFTPGHLLPWIVGVREAKRILFTAPRVTAADAERHGIVTRVVPDGDVDRRALALAHLVAAMPPLHLRLAKAAVDQCLDAMGAGATSRFAAAAESLMRASTPNVDETLAAGGIAALLAEQRSRFAALEEAWDR